MKKLLIANRGEIARRITRTARAMGIQTVALHADSEADALHVREADEAVPLGPDEDRPFLDGARIVGIARARGVDAIHPGYGYLSENADFAQAVVEAGMVFVGPPAAAIRAMALKDAAKALMKKAGVPVTPGYQGSDQSLVRMQKAAAQIGYPLLIKAVAGGGGKGMRTVEREAELAAALLAAKREGEAAFGNPSVLLERLVRRARHVEVQVFADTHGNTVHLFERDCSLQRRHQKVIEEAPAPGLSARLRQRLGEAAVTAAAAIGYVNAGTVEFLLDLDAPDAEGDPAFYFMEMNTRLQVEHPVTEAITGLDLVEWQLRVARGEPLPLAQAAIAHSGHAVEARLYAEDAEGGFLPSTGQLEQLAFGPGLRIETGVEAGSPIGLDYDPMIAKLIAHGSSRAEALARLVRGLDATVIEGVKTNRQLLARLVSHPAFVAGDFDTGFIGRHLDALKAVPPCPPQALALAAAVLALPAGVPEPHPFARPFRLNLPHEIAVRLWEEGERRELVLRPLGRGRFRITGLPGLTEIGVCRLEDGSFRLTGDTGSITAHVHVRPHTVEVRLGGQTHRLARRAPVARDSGTGSGQLHAPMPGRVLAVEVGEAERVEVGQPLLVLEAMKMEHRLTAPRAGVITALHVRPGDQVADGMLLLEIGQGLSELS